MGRLLIVLVLIALAGCGATYQLTSPDGWSANVQSYRDLDAAKIKLNPQGELVIDVRGVDSNHAIEQTNLLLLQLLQRFPPLYPSYQGQTLLDDMWTAPKGVVQQ